MALAVVRSRFTGFFAKQETTQGTDVIAASPSASDWVGGSLTWRPVMQTIDDPGTTMTLDLSTPIIGGQRAEITLSVPLRGSGTAGTAPAWGKILEACTMLELITAAEVGGPTNATAGTVNTVTAAAPFGITAQQYRGMPLLLSGDQIDNTSVINYTTGRVITIPDTRTAMTTATALQIPINVLYSPTSVDANQQTLTIYHYVDGNLFIFTGCAGTWGLQATAGGTAYLTFTLMGRLVTPVTQVAVPVALMPSIAAVPPLWVGGRSQYQGGLARSNSFTLTANVSTIMPDNPEEDQGYDPAMPITRAAGGTMSPLMDTTVDTQRFAAYTAGTRIPLMAAIGNTAGNRFVISIPTAVITQMTPVDRGGLQAWDVSFVTDGPDAGFFIASY